MLQININFCFAQNDNEFSLVCYNYKFVLFVIITK